MASASPVFLLPFAYRQTGAKEDFMSLQFGAVIFDLDGTLLDTLEDLADSANAALAEFGFPRHPGDAYRFFVGDGIETMMRRIAPADTDVETVRRLVAVMREKYAGNWANKTRPYNGIPAVLEELGASSVRMAVLSNKPHRMTESTIRHFFPAIAFCRVQGSPRGGTAKPDPAMALDIAADFGLKPEQVLFVGDSRTDMDTATAAGMIPAGALWGFRPESELLAHGAKALLERPEQLLDLAGSSK